MMDKWDWRYVYLAREVSTWSKDPRSPLGSVIVKDRRVLGTGYNGFPRGVGDNLDRYQDRPIKLKFVVHAEANAILNCERRPDGATLYLWSNRGLPICNECAKLVIQAGIVRVVYSWGDNPIWQESAEFAYQMFLEAGVQVEKYTHEED